VTQDVGRDVVKLMDKRADVCGVLHPDDSMRVEAHGPGGVTFVRGVLRVVGVKLKKRHAPPQRRALRGAAKELNGEAESLFAHSEAAGGAFHVRQLS
jgi:hypothetical protein